MKDEATTVKEEGLQFARKYSTVFNSFVHKGLGRLLTRMAADRRRGHRRLKLVAEQSS
jgi:hypothetical protein